MAAYVNSIEKCMSNTTDGGLSMVEKYVGLVEILKQKRINCLHLHYIINQPSLCGKNLKDSPILLTILELFESVFCSTKRHFRISENGSNI